MSSFIMNMMSRSTLVLIRQAGMLARQQSAVNQLASIISVRRLHRSARVLDAQHGSGGGENKPAAEEFDPRRSNPKKKFDFSALPATIWGYTVAFVQGTWRIIQKPSIVSDWWVETRPKVMHELRHYWLGSKLLVADTKIAYRLVRRVTQGEHLTRRERRQLLRTVADLFRLVPFLFFVIVPFAEFSLPFFLKIFPNMLPSQFQEKLQEQEKIKQQLALRMDLAEFLNDTLDTMARSKESQEEGKQLAAVLERVRNGEHVSNDQIIRIAKLFRDEITLDSIARPQLVSMCKYMGLAPYGPDVLLRVQLRRQLQSIEADDELIMKEGLENLSIEEIKQACIERGMRASGVSDEMYRRHLKQWLELSLKQDIPASLLILSRAFTIHERSDTLSTPVPQKAAADALKATLVSMDEDVLEDAMLESGHLLDREKRLEATQRQSELIEEEREDIKEEQEKVVKELLQQQQQQQQQAAAATAPTTAAVDASGLAPAAAASTASAALKEAAVKVTPIATAASTETPPPVSHLHQQSAAQAPPVSAPAAVATTEVVATPQVPPVVPTAAVMTPQQLKMISEALLVMASDSAVAKEKEKLAELKTELTHMQQDAQVQQDPSAKKMSERMEQMFKRLEQQIATAETKIGTAMKVLDKDKDGVVSTEEIQTVVREYLKGGAVAPGSSGATLDPTKIAELLDSDNDQRVAVKILDKLTEDPDEEAEDKEKEKERQKDREEKEKKEREEKLKQQQQAQAQAQVDAQAQGKVKTQAEGQVTAVNVAATADTASTEQNKSSSKTL